MPCRYNTLDGRLLWFDGVDGKRGLTLTVFCFCFCLFVFVVVIILFYILFFWGAGGGSNCFIV